MKTIFFRTSPYGDKEFQRLSSRATDELLLEYCRTFGHGKRARKIKLWRYQEEAIRKWIDNDFSTIFEMATGTGKTFAALGCLEHLVSAKKKTITVISCPYNHMITQWREDLEEYGIQINTLVADSSRPHWKDNVADSIRDINNDVEEHLVVLTTHDSFYRKDFLDIMAIAKVKLFLIADEVHGIRTTPDWIKRITES